jgi:hypothetical protein
VCWKLCSSCWSHHLEEFLSAPIHSPSPLSGLPYRSFRCPRPLLHPHLQCRPLQPLQPRQPRLTRQGIPRLQRLQSDIKARERVFNSPTGLGATSSGCAHAHPPRTTKNNTSAKTTQLSLSVSLQLTHRLGDY